MPLRGKVQDDVPRWLRAREEKEYKMRYILILLGLMFAGVASAMDCQKLPSCESLGYASEDDPTCAANGYVYCPFDETYKRCVIKDCTKLGFTESDKTSWCADLIKCKGNAKMTLCQKSCFATTAQELKELAESGKCKVVTMRNDITIPLNQTILLEANTIIDGGGHTLQTSRNKGDDVYRLYDNTGFRNIIIKHNQTQSQKDLRVFRTYNDTKKTFHNTTILVNSEEKKHSVAPLFFAGTYEISGKFTVDIQAPMNFILTLGNLTFKNADINVTTTGSSSDAFAGKTEFINSHGTITTSGASVVSTQTLSFQNSKIHLNVPTFEIFYSGDDKEPGTILLQDNANVKLTFSKLTITKVGMSHIKFETLENAPAQLIVEGTQNLNLTDVTTSNTKDTVILNGVTYHPKKAGTTLLSEIDKSPDWEKLP